jgi:hypothetical protein
MARCGSFGRLSGAGPGTADVWKSALWCKTPILEVRIEKGRDQQQALADRAASVVEFLQSQGIAGARISSEGYGSKYPVASNDTKEGRSKNRRVQVVLAEGVIAAPTQ